jgi:hypothetical protein
MRGNPVRKTILYGAAGAVLCAAALLVFVFAATQDRADWPADGVGTLLWVLEGQTADGVGTKAMGIIRLAPTGDAVVSIPTDISVKGRDGRLVELGDLGEEDGWKTCCDAVSLLLGVDVAGYVVLASDEVVSFCDALGPVNLDVPAPVAARRTAKDGASVEISRGKQQLSGADVLAYIEGISEEPAVERQERALRGILAAASAAGPAGKPALRVRSNLDGGRLLAVGETLSRADAPLKVQEIPSTVMVRDGVARRVAMVVETEKLVASAVRAKATLTSDDISVAVFNGSGARLAATRAAEYLQARGFRVPRIGNADAFTYSTTTIVRLTEEAKAWILRDTLPGAAKITTKEEFGAHYESLRPMIPLGTDLVLVVGAGMEFSE